MTSRLVQFTSTRPTIRPGAIIRPIIECSVGPEIAFGGFGSICAAREVNSDKEFIIKFLNSPDPRLLKRELLATRVKNSHVVEVIGYSEAESAILMERVRGETLRSLLYRKKRLTDSSEYLSLFSQIALGLSAIHDAGIVHLDLNPKNILINQEGKIKIVDFGSAIEAGLERSTFCFTHPYIAPDQLTSRINNYPIDLFHFGLFMYESIMGCYPGNLDQIPEANGAAFAILYSRTDSFNLNYLNDQTDVPHFLRYIISRSLDFNPDSRITTKEIIEIFDKNNVQTTPFVRILTDIDESEQTSARASIPDVVILDSTNAFLAQEVNGFIGRKKFYDIIRTLFSRFF